MSKRERWGVLAIVSSALFLICVDVTVLYTALPRLTQDLGASAAQKLWILNAYPLVVAGLLPGMGTLGDRIGYKPLFMGGLVVFGIASLIAAFAPTPPVLIAGRALLAVGAAMMMPATLSIIRHVFEDERERAIAFGVWAGVASGGAALGPVLGGALLEVFWWGSVFLINAPIVLVALIAAHFKTPALKPSGGPPWDLVGSAQIMVGLIALAFAVKEAAQHSPSLAAVAAALLLGAAALTLFARRQRRARHPLIDFALFRRPLFAAGVATAVVAMVAMIGVELALSQRLQLVLGYTPLQAGLFLLPVPLGAFLAGPLAGWLMGRAPVARMLGAPLALTGLGAAGLLAAGDAGESAGIALQLAALGVVGVGIGAAMTAASATIMTTAPAERAGMAASIEETSYELGGAVGVALMGALMTAVYGAAFVAPAGGVFPAAAFEGIDQALSVAAAMPGAEGDALAAAARAAFDRAFEAVCALAAALMLAAGLALWRVAGRKAGAGAASRQAAS
ncbi:MAG: MFS transporter [Alphaproteobacteria bacterium]|nr:MFS transporter [Alphaproteobacteria bacterium]